MVGTIGGSSSVTVSMVTDDSWLRAGRAIRKERKKKRNAWQEEEWVDAMLLGEPFVQRPTFRL